MLTSRHPKCHLVPLVGIGLMLAGLFGGPTLPAVSAAEGEPLTYQHDWRAQSPYGYQHPWGQQDDWGRRDPWGQPDPWGYRHARPSPRSGYGLPDRYTIHRGKKCELRCERIRGTHKYSCREYRC